MIKASLYWLEVGGERINFNVLFQHIVNQTTIRAKNTPISTPFMFRLGQTLIV